MAYLCCAMYYYETGHRENDVGVVVYGLWHCMCIQTRLNVGNIVIFRLRFVRRGVKSVARDWKKIAAVRFGGGINFKLLARLKIGCLLISRPVRQDELDADGRHIY